jgi:hypothetical protein
MSTYSNVVKLALAGHIHMDAFGVTAADPSPLPLRITPAVSPIYKNNPAFSVMTYGLKTGSVSDITTYFLPLSSQAPSWSKEYQFSSAYDVSTFSAGNLSTIATAIHGGGTSRTTFEKDYAVSAPSPIHPSNLPFLFLRAQTLFAPTSYSDCVCRAAPSGSQQTVASLKCGVSFVVTNRQITTSAFSMSRSLMSRVCSLFFLHRALLFVVVHVSLLSTGFLFALWMSCLGASSVPVGVREESRCCYLSVGLRRPKRARSHRNTVSSQRMNRVISHAACS